MHYPGKNFIYIPNIVIMTYDPPSQFSNEGQTSFESSPHATVKTIIFL